MAGGVAGTIAVGDWRAPLTCEELPGNLFRFTATIRIPAPQRWWPHTHGPQPLYDVQAFLKGQIDETIDLGRIGFRTVDVDSAPTATDSASSSTARRSSAAASAGRHSTSQGCLPIRWSIAPRLRCCAMPA